MATEEGLLSLAKYNKKARILKPSKVTVEYFDNRDNPKPRDDRSDEAQGETLSDDKYQPKRPQVTSRQEVLAMASAEPTSHSGISTMAVSSSEPKSPESSKSPRSKIMSFIKPKSPRSHMSSKSAKSPESKRSWLSGKTLISKSSSVSDATRIGADYSFKSAKSAQSKSKKTKKQPLLSKSKGNEANPKRSGDRKTISQAAYRPPVIASNDDKNEAKTEQRELPARFKIPDSDSMGSDTMRKDRYMTDMTEMTEEPHRTEAKRPTQNTKAKQSMLQDDQNDRCSTYAGYSSAMETSLFNDSTKGSSGIGTYDEGYTDRDTYDEGYTDKDTYDEGYTDTDTYDDGYTENNDTFTDDTYFETQNSSSDNTNKRDKLHSLSENSTFGDGSVIIKQHVAWGCIGLSAIQFAILTTQVLLCGIAALSINPTIGPYPDAFSEWGGKNTYLLVEGEQYFRFITPTFLHVGYLHLIVNVFFQLETCAYLEREWGFLTWTFVYLMSGFGSCLAASAIDPDVIGVCSSGALMGLFGARISQAILWTHFESNDECAGQGAMVFERLGGTVCSAAVLFFLTFLTYIDWSGHLGGMFTGFLVGFIVFSHAIRDAMTRAAMRFAGFLGLLLGGSVLGVIVFHYAQPDKDLADVCQYFRNLYSEGYTCECQAFD